MHLSPSFNPGEWPDLEIPGLCLLLPGPWQAAPGFHSLPGLKGPSAESFLGRVLLSLQASALSAGGTHTKLRTMAPAKPTSRKKGREPRMEVMTIMPPLRRPGHVSMTEYGIAAEDHKPFTPQTLGLLPGPGIPCSGCLESRVTYIPRACLPLIPFCSLHVPGHSLCLQKVRYILTQDFW